MEGFDLGSISKEGLVWPVAGSGKGLYVFSFSASTFLHARTHALQLP